MDTKKNLTLQTSRNKPSLIVGEPNLNQTYNSMIPIEMKENIPYLSDSNGLIMPGLSDSYSCHEYPMKTRKRDGNRNEFKITWSAEEDKLLKKLVKETKSPRNWKKIAENFPDKNDLLCQSRWEKISNPELYEKCKKKPWTEEEDAKVIELVHKYGPQKWTFIADHLPGRIGKQCRERWHNHLNPRIKKSNWTDEEEWILFLSHKISGNRWADIAKNITGRTDNSIKNHWNSSMKKRMPELLNRFIKIRETGGLNNPANTANVSELEYKLLDKLLAMGDNDFHTKNGILIDVQKCKPSKSGRGYDTKGRSKTSAMELKSYNSFNKFAKMEELPVKIFSENSPTPPSHSLKFKKAHHEHNYHNREPKVLENTCNVTKTKLEFSSQEYEVPSSDHLKMIEQMYNSQYFQPFFQMNSIGLPQQDDLASRQTNYTDQPAYLYRNDPSPFVVKKEHEAQKVSNDAQNYGLMQSPALKLEPKSYGNEVTYERYYQRENDENVNSANITKVEAFANHALYGSPLRKKVKYNTMHSPNMIDNEPLKATQKITDKTNKMNVNTQGNPKDYPNFNNFSYSPLHVKFESPSKMMNFCTPERVKEPRLESAGKQTFFNLNPVEKSPSLFMNKRYLTPQSNG